MEIFEAIERTTTHGGVYMEEFVDAALSMRGSAKAKDVVTVRMQLGALSAKVDMLFAVVLRIDNTLNAPPFKRSCDNLKEREEKVYRWERELQHREKAVLA